MSQLTIQQAFGVAIGHHQAGRLREAEQIYRQILVQQPGQADALHLLGVIAHQSGRNDVAVELIGQAIARHPGFAEAQSNLGVALSGLGRFEEAVAAYRQAIALKPEYAEAHNNLGNALKDLGRLEEAEAAYRQAIALKGDYAEAQSNLGVALRAQGQLEESAAACRQAIALNGGYADAYSNLGIALRDLGRFDEAIGAFSRAIALKPDFAQAHSNLAVALRDRGRFEESIAACRRAIAIRGNYAEAWSNLSVALKEHGRLEEAVAAARQAVAIDPNYAEAQNNLGNALRDQGLLDESAAACRRAIALAPEFADAYNNLGNVYKDEGRLEEAVSEYRRAIEFKPGYVEAHSNLVFALSYHRGYEAGAIGEELRRWNQQHAEPLKKFIEPHGNDHDPERRLRVGYVSPDLRDHVVGRNLLPLFQRRDRVRFEVTCYANVACPDGMSAEFERCSERWRNIVGVPDEEVARQVREDRIDILVDLALHTAGNRLLVFARKPAPVQATFAGYPGSTGLEAMDYRVTDPYLDPLEADGGGEWPYSEESWRLTKSFWCFDPQTEEPVVGPLPALAKRVVTFGCLNNFCKVNEGVLELWAKVLGAVAGSRLLLMAKEGSVRQRTVDFLSARGVAGERVEFCTPRPRAAYLALYQQIDIGLDTLPYNGHTTSLDSYWMGVPVVTLVGRTVVGRAGLSQLTNLGLGELAAGTAEEFAAVAAGLAGDVPRLQVLRSTLRERMKKSPLMDAVLFAGSLEGAYRGMWRKWCAGQNHEV